MNYKMIANAAPIAIREARGVDSINFFLCIIENSQIQQCISPISQNAPLKIEMRTLDIVVLLS